jgi:hypothetical protein
VCHTTPRGTIQQVRTDVLGAAAAFEGEERWTVDKVKGGGRLLGAGLQGCVVCGA